MLARIQKSIREKDAGFTLIELLVVMIIIGILAAIAIPVFLSQRAKAQDSATKADVSVIGKEIASYYVDAVTTTPPAVTVDGSGYYTVAGAQVGRKSANVTGTGSNGAIVVTPATGASSTAWCVSLTNPQGSGADTAAKTWKYSAAGGLTQGTCSTAGV